MFAGLGVGVTSVVSISPLSNSKRNPIQKGINLDNY
jgi:hypothetical protein